MCIKRIYLFANLTQMPELNKIPARIVVHTRDVENITGLSRRTALRLLNKIREVVGKNEEQFVTIEEFCDYYGLNEEKIKEYFK